MFKCAFCGKLYKTAPERSICEIKCQGIELKAEESTSKPVVEEASELGVVGKLNLGEGSDFATNKADRRKFAKQKQILRVVALLSSLIESYESEYDEVVIPKHESVVNPFCVFLDPESKARVHIFDAKKNEYVGFGDFDADQCENDCDMCKNNTCYNLVKRLTEFPENINHAHNEPEVPSCDGDCARCGQARGSRVTASNCAGDCASRKQVNDNKAIAPATLTPEELMLLYLGLMFR